MVNSLPTDAVKTSGMFNFVLDHLATNRLVDLEMIEKMCNAQGDSAAEKSEVKCAPKGAKTRIVKPSVEDCFDWIIRRIPKFMLPIGDLTFCEYVKQVLKKTERKEQVRRDMQRHDSATHGLNYGCSDGSMVGGGNKAPDGYADSSGPELRSFGLGRQPTKRKSKARSKRKASKGTEESPPPCHTGCETGSPAYNPKKTPRVDVTRPSEPKAKAKASAGASAKANANNKDGFSTKGMKDFWNDVNKRAKNPPPMKVEYRSNKGPKLDMVVVDDKEEGDSSPPYQDGSPSPVRGSSSATFGEFREVLVVNPDDEKVYIPTPVQSEASDNDDSFSDAELQLGPR